MSSCRRIELCGLNATVLQRVNHVRLGRVNDSLSEAKTRGAIEAGIRPHGSVVVFLPLLNASITSFSVSDCKPVGILLGASYNKYMFVEIQQSPLILERRIIFPCIEHSPVLSSALPATLAGFHRHL